MYIYPCLSIYASLICALDEQYIYISLSNESIFWCTIFFVLRYVVMVYLNNSIRKLTILFLQGFVPFVCLHRQNLPVFQPEQFPENGDSMLCITYPVSNSIGVVFGEEPYDIL
jgi:hypothetical protein